MRLLSFFFPPFLPFLPLFFPSSLLPSIIRAGATIGGPLAYVFFCGDNLPGLLLSSESVFFLSLFSAQTTHIVTPRGFASSDNADAKIECWRFIDKIRQHDSFL